MMYKNKIQADGVEEEKSHLRIVPMNAASGNILTLGMDHYCVRHFRLLMLHSY